MDAGEVNVKLTADTSDVIEGFKRARDEMGRFVSGAQTMSETSGAALAATGALSVFVGDQLTQMFEKVKQGVQDFIKFPYTAAVAAGQAAEQFDQLAQRTGIAVDALEGLQVAMAREGLDAGALAQGFRKLSGEIVGMQEGTAASTDLFRQLGISAETVAQGTGVLMNAIVDRFAGMADGAEKSRFAIELFGRSGLQLIPILNQGSAGLEAAMRKAAEFGLILNATQQKDLKVFDDSLDDLGSALKGFTAQVGAAFAPSLTALVRFMTDAVVAAKDVFVLFADAGEKLTIRLAAMVAVIETVGKQLFSFSVFSKQAWKDTLDQVQAIDQWAAAQIKSVDASRQQGAALGDLANAHLNTAQAVQSHIDHQKVLGEGIVSTTGIMVKQREELNHKIFEQIFNEEDLAKQQRYLAGPEPGIGSLEAQKRAGQAIVDLTRVQNAVKLEESRKYYDELFTLEENAAKAAYLQGPEPGIGSGAAQAQAAQNIIANAQVVRQVQQEATNQQLSDAKLAADAEMALQSAVYANQLNIFGGTASVRQAAQDQILADLNIRKQAELQSLNDGKITYEQYQAHLVYLEQQGMAKRMNVARQYPTFWEKQLDDLVASNTFSMSQIVSGFTNATAQWIVNGTKFTQFWKSLQVTLVQAALNTFVQISAGFIKSLLAQKTAEEALEAAKTAAFMTGETARMVVAKATQVAIMTMMIGQVAGMAAMATAALAMATAVQLTVSAIGYGAALILSMVPFMEEAGAALAAATMEFDIASGAAILTGGAGVATAAAAAKGIIAAGGVSAQEGGFGDFGAGTPAVLHGKEAIIPLDRMGGSGFGRQTIIVELDKRVLTRAVLQGMPGEVRLRLGNAF